MLQATNIHKVFHNGKKTLAVLKGIDLKIAQGDFLAIVGPSGAGKSTLLHILGGLDTPSQGKVVLAGENIYRLSDAGISRLRNQTFGFVFQFYHLLPEFTVLENVLMPALIYQGSGFRVQGSVEKAEDLLKQVGLAERITHFPNQLSGGEKQRVAIARALVNHPQLLFCDEPTGNLDSVTGSGIISLIKEIHRDRRMTIVMVTHNLELAKSADQVYHLRDGVLVN
jgi:lipoprotein-releasing system ATP-binding protein